MRLWGVLFAGAPIAVVPFLLLAFGFGERWPSLAYFAFGMPAWLNSASRILLRRSRAVPVLQVLITPCWHGWPWHSGR